ncbi:MAG: thioredoxin family protein [Lentisphaerae bacterium]|nr:thioredoxin family protein [Lentisphaerota bacterium]
MKTGMAVVAALVVGARLVVAAPDVDGARVGQWTMDVEAAKALAAERQLPIFLNFTGSDWCGWCKLMDKQVFSQAAWADYATQSIVLVWVDFPQDESLVPEKFRDRNKALGEQYHVEGYPTYVVLDADGKTELGRLGADRNVTPAAFIRKLEDVLGNRASAISAMVESLGAERGAAYREKVARLAAAREEQARVEADATATLKKLGEEIESLEKALESTRTDWRLSKLTDAQRAAYESASQAYEAQAQVLQDWLKSDPERSEENQQKFTDLSAKVADLEAARNAALRGE